MEIISFRVATREFRDFFCSMSVHPSEIVPVPRVTLRPVWLVLIVIDSEDKMSHFDLILFINIISCYKYLSWGTRWRSV
jgi:hypothetical protein